MHRFAGGCAVVVAFGGVVDGVWRCTGAPDVVQFNYRVYLVPGIDGQAGDAIFDNYRNAFRNPRPPMRGVIDVGTTGASAGTD
ncbi:hypothetical protein [Nitrosomonas halophila]|uniref:Uncharacterized protein n=1 Tax=Nitrosomonas halophila TaxID=44576 RepID=A0A1H3P4I8_9PROT|nr:hypothetical protein [Nitrosomonas halophila]SDY95971.1 hypothetical protein SAMN05421881_108710 [Nitrosomonas halophila]